MRDHVLIQDVVPYETPSSLEALEGSNSCVVLLPQSVHWGPEPQADLSTRDGLQKAYGSLIREGTAAQQEQLLNRDLLLSVWDTLRLPARGRAVWEARFPELRDVDHFDG